MSVLDDYQDRSLIPLLDPKATPDLKQLLKGLDQELQQRFLHGEPIRRLVRQRAWALDQILIHLFQRFTLLDASGLALLAVGGYGRGELLPYSDVDILVLLPEEPKDDKLVHSIEQFLAELWNLGLQIGHSVRTLDDCAREAEADITVMTNLMEYRCLCGQLKLASDMQLRLAPQQLWPAQAFFKAKLNEQVHRHQKYQDTEYNLEPNVKTSPGGLRDLQTITWVTRRAFGTHTFKALMQRGFLTQEEYKNLLDGQAFLWRVRWALHSECRRGEDRLRFDLQRQIASLFGFEDEDGRLAVEKFMQQYYRTVFEVSLLNELLLQQVQDHLFPEQQAECEEVNNRFVIRAGRLEAKHDQVFRRTPSALLEVFLILAQQQERVKGPSPSLARLIRSNRHLIDGNYRNDIRHTSLFLELLRSPLGISTNLRRMNRLGILGKFIPEFAQIAGQMQYDLFHVYTVDAHLLLVIRNLRKFRHKNNTQSFPLANQIVRELPKVELLYLAGLFHDIGKGRGGDHSLLGAVDAQRFCQRLRLGNNDCDLVSWLVENHLLMSFASQREDLSDPAVIHAFCEKVRDIRRLNYLYVLTVADISATNPVLWTNWRASLMKQLYDQALRAFRRGLENPVDKQERIAETKAAALSLLEGKGFDTQMVLAFWDNPGDDYFLRECPEDIAWHLEAITQAGPGQPLVLVKQSDAQQFDGATQVFVYAPDRAHLFADIVTRLDQLQLSIADARIMTSSSSQFSLDTFIVQEQLGSMRAEDPQRLLEIQIELQQMLQDGQPLKAIRKRRATKLKHFHVPEQVTIANDLNNDRSIIEVIATDRPGLLADIGALFKQHHIRLQNARISTLGERVEDVFFVVGPDNQPLNDLHQCQQLQQDLLQLLAEDRP